MRRLAFAFLAAGCALAGARSVSAQPIPFPIVAPSPPGSGWDHVAQGLAAGLVESAAPVQPIIVNVPGGSGLTGLNRFVSGQVDSRLLVTGLTMLEATLAGRNPAKIWQLTPIARLVQEPYGIIVPAASALVSVNELRSVLSGDPARLSWAGGPLGGVDHVATVLLHQAVGLEMSRLNYVPFLSSGDAASAVAEGRVGAALLALGEAAPAVKAGTVRLLAVTSATAKVVPEIPVLQAVGIPFSFANWRGVVGAPGLEAGERARLTGLIEKAIDTRSWGDHLRDRYWEAAYLAGDAFGDFIQAEHARLKGALLAAGLLKRPLD